MIRAWYCICLLALTLLPSSCGKAPAVGTGKLIVISGVPPVANLVSRIGGDRVDSRSLLPEGRSPHDYEPTLQDVREAASARLLLTVGMPFERRFAELVPRLKLIDAASGVRRIPFDGGAEHQHDGHHHDEEGLDPHVWLDANNLRVISRNVAAALTAADPDGTEVYASRLAALETELAQLKNAVLTELAPCKGGTFFVHHPAFGYFAHMTGMRQVAVELGGREPSAAHLKAVIALARQHQVKVIFVQPQFNPGTARALARAIGGKVESLDPLAADAPANLRHLSKVLRPETSGGGVRP